MADDLYHLAYVSDARLADPEDRPDPRFLEYSLKKILETARKNNKATEVTGALLYTGKHFAQVLEGPQRAVNHWFQLISQDLRHGNVTPLFYERITERQFDGWSMALCQGEEVPDSLQITGAKPDPDSVEAAALGRSILNSLVAAIRKRQGH